MNMPKCSDCGAPIKKAEHITNEGRSNEAVIYLPHFTCAASCPREKASRQRTVKVRKRLRGIMKARVSQ